MDENLKKQITSSHGRKILLNFLTEKVKAPELIDDFDNITNIYLQVNAVVNISAIKSIDDIYIKHYLDSIYPYELFTGTVCDVGCGGGFPTLPLALTTKLNVTGVESVGKKLRLIHRCISELGIKNVTTEYARSEELAKNNKSYDTVCARALADVDKALALCAPLTKNGGQVILYRTQNDETAKTSTLNKVKMTLSDQIDYVLPETDIKRRIFVYKK
ncbi:MAG: 16S rRNA (guanine(527)-N(7))-methyltransferase RsmG [Clostridiales bacterium]|nr:16S rRNA (guanine(527)-N(7))-methyltransferase RsmG [Clostridiales bacterium]